MNDINHTGYTSESHKRSVIYWEEKSKSLRSVISMSNSMEMRRASTCS